MADNNRPKILVVGSFIKDLIVSSSRFPDAGETVIGSGFQTASGGKGANQAIQAARLGADVTMVGKVGDDTYGREMIQSCQESGVNTEHILVDEVAPSGIGNVQLEVQADGSTQNRIIIVPGANMTNTVEELKFLETEIANFDTVVLQLEIPMEINEYVVKLAHENSVPVMLNPAPFDDLSEEMLSKLTYFSPNEHEAKGITGIPIKRDESGAVDEAAIAATVAYMVDLGVENVLITLGDKGAAIGNANGFTIVPAVRGVTSVDPTAAGDSFVAAFATLVAMDVEHEVAVRIANYVGALTVTKMGAQPSLPYLEDLRNLITKNGEIELLEFIN